jgi:hypothetical protein
MSCSRSHFSLEANAAQIGGDVLRGLLAVFLESRIGRDRRDPQQIKKTIDALVEILIDPIENGLKKAHGYLRRDVSTLAMSQRDEKQRRQNSILTRAQGSLLSRTTRSNNFQHSACQLRRTVFKVTASRRQRRHSRGDHE